MGLTGSNPPSELAVRVLSGDLRAIARGLRLVDDQAPGSNELLKALWPHTGRAWVVGVTGSPGAGKSTLCDRLITLLRSRGDRVGVIAVDPSSPFSGGAILGDRIRMSRHATDDGVFIRSVATRGHLGGLSRSARSMVRVLDAAAYDVVLVETVGVGQDELEITRTAHSTLVVVAPGMGDDIQAIKAGILECADVFAVNKADREGADGTVRDLELMMSLGPSERDSPTVSDCVHERWAPSIIKCIATRGEGLAELLEALDRHRGWVRGTERGRSQRHARLVQEIREALREALLEAAVDDLGPDLEAALAAVEARAVDPYTATERLVELFRSRS